MVSPGSSMKLCVIGIFACLQGVAIADGDNGPALTVRWGRSPKYLAIDQKILKEIGATHVWYCATTGNKPDLQTQFLEQIQEAKAAGYVIQTEVGPRVPEEKSLELGAQNPSWRVERFEITDPAKAGSEELVIDLRAWAMARIGTAKPKNKSKTAFDFNTRPDRFWRVLDRTAGEIVPASDWKFADEKVTLKSKPDHSYSVIFLPGAVAAGVDETLPEVRPICMDSVQRAIDAGGDILRGIHLAYTSHSGAKPANDWYSYGATTSLRQIDAFEKQTGKSFDPMWFLPDGIRYTSDDPPLQGYLDWMAFTMANAEDLAKAYTDHAHAAGRTVKFFWGDGWIGIEPYAGSVDRAGYDGLDLPTNGAMDIRRLMDFSGKATRIARVWVHGNSSEDSINGVWLKAKKAALLRFPDGLTVADSNLNMDLTESPELRKTVKGVFEEFRGLHKHLNSAVAYDGLLNLYVLNAWGEIRSWPRAPYSTNPSQRIFDALVDLPIRTRFISLTEIEMNGIPADADVILNVGEAGSSWSGGSYWSEKSAGLIRDFVRRGGGFVGVDAPAVKDGKCLLQDVLGIKYVGPADELAGLGIFNVGDAARKYIDISKRAAKTEILSGTPMTLDGKFGGGLEKGRRSSVTTTSRVTLDGAELVAGSPEGAMASEHHFDKGLAVYLSGYEAGSPQFNEFVKRLIYAASGKMDVFTRLDSPTPGGHVYYYPESRLLVIYNSGSPDGRVTVKAGLLDQAFKFQLDPVFGATVPLDLQPGELRSGKTFDVPSGTAQIYRFPPRH